MARVVFVTAIHTPVLVDLWFFSFDTPCISGRIKISITPSRKHKVLCIS
jgi:hypothetical protein